MSAFYKEVRLLSALVTTGLFFASVSFANGDITLKHPNQITEKPIILAAKGPKLRPIPPPAPREYPTRVSPKTEEYVAPRKVVPFTEGYKAIPNPKPSSYRPGTGDERIPPSSIPGGREIAPDSTAIPKGGTPGYIAPPSARIYKQKPVDTAPEPIPAIGKVRPASGGR